MRLNATAGGRRRRTAARLPANGNVENPRARVPIDCRVLQSLEDQRDVRLTELDGQICDLLAGWHGGAGGAYGEAWNSWHQGAAEVQQGLSTLARTVAVVGA